MSTSTPPPARRGILDLGLVAVGVGILAVDQLTKHLVTQSLGPGAPEHSTEVLGSFFRLSYTTNTGAAFGMFPEKTIVFTLIAALAVPLLLFSRLFIAEDSLLVRLSLGLLLGGTLGNLVDRIRLGHVVDFIDVGIDQLRWYSFNVADSAFVVGVTILAFYMLFLAEDGEPQSATRGLASRRAGTVEDQPDQHLAS